MTETSSSPSPPSCSATSSPHPCSPLVLSTPLSHLFLRSLLPLFLLLLVLSLHPLPSHSFPASCSPYTAAVSQNCYLYLSTPIPFVSPSSANAYTSRYDCALALGYLLPCLLTTANASYATTYAALATTPCLLGRGSPSLVNHSQLTVVEVDSAGQAGLLSSYKHDNSSLNGNVGSCAGSALSVASAGVSFSGAACCSVDHALLLIAQQALSTIQAGISKSSYHLTPTNTAVPPSATQAGQAATAGLACPPAGLPSFPVSVRCNGPSALSAQAALVSQLCYFNPLLATPSPPPATLTTVGCALAWGEFALCQQALNNASAALLSSAAARLNARAHVAVVNVSACGSSCSSLSSGTATATSALLQATYLTLTGVGNCVYTPPQLPVASPTPCVSAAQSVQLYCQFNPRFILPTSLPPFLNKTECAVPFLSYAVCALSQVNQSGCNSQRSTPNVSLAAALQPTACSFDSKLLPLISRAITTVQTVNNTAATATALRRVNGGLCSATPAAVFSSCMGLDVNAAVNTTGLACPSMACAVAYASYAACFLAQHACTASSPMLRYPACPDVNHQVATFLSTCYSAVVSQSFTGYLYPPPAPLTGCSSTALSLFVANVQPTLSVPTCSVSSLFGGFSAAVLSTCYFYPLLASLPAVPSSCSVPCAWALTSYTQCQQRLLLSAVNRTLAIDSTLSAVQSRLLPVVQPASSSYSLSSSLCSLGQSCLGDVHLVPYLSTCLASLQSLPLLSCPATVSGLLCSSTPAAVSSACLGLNVANFTVTSGFGCPSRACAVAYTQYAACYLRQTPCHPQQLRSDGFVIGNASGVSQACPDVQGQVGSFLSICYQAALSNAYTGYLIPPPTLITTRCNYTAITPFQQTVLAPNSPVLTAATPCTAATLFSAFAPAVQQDCYFNPLLSDSPTYTSQCSPACSYALALYLRCYSALGNASANTLVRTNVTLTKGTPQPVVAPVFTSGSSSFTCGLGVACSFVVPFALQVYTATCLQLLQATAQTCLPVPAAIVVPPAPTANLSLLSTGGCVMYMQPVLVSCSLYVTLPIAFNTLYTRFPSGSLSKECAVAVARYASCYLTAQPLQSGNASCTGACSLNQDVVMLARLAVAALHNASVTGINPSTLSLITVNQETCSSVAPQLPALCGVQLSAGRLMVNYGVLNCTLACAQQLTVYAECRLRSTAVCANRTYPVQGAGALTSVTVPAYPSFPYPQASTNASVGQGRCVDVDSSLFAFLSFCNLTLTGNPPVPHSSSSSTAAAASSSLVSSSGVLSSRSSSRFSSSPSTAGPTSAPYVTSSSPPPTYSFALLLTMMGADFTVTINATLSCALTVPPLYSLNSVFTVVAMTGIRSFTSLTGAQPNATSLITGVAPPGSYGGSDNSMYPLQPSLLDQNGLDYLLSPAAPLGDVAGTYGFINLYSSNGVYKEEAQGGGVEPTISSSASLLPLFPTLSSSSPFVTSSPISSSSVHSYSLSSLLLPSSSPSQVSSSPLSSSVVSSSVPLSSSLSSSPLSSSAVSSSVSSSLLSSSPLSSSIPSSSLRSSSPLSSSAAVSSSAASSSVSSSVSSSSSPSSSVSPSPVSSSITSASSSSFLSSSPVSSSLSSSSPSTLSLGCPLSASLVVLDYIPLVNFTAPSAVVAIEPVGFGDALIVWGTFTTPASIPAFAVNQTFFQYTLPPQGAASSYSIEFGVYSTTTPYSLVYQGSYVYTPTTTSATNFFTVTVSAQQVSPGLTLQPNTGYYLAFWSPANFVAYFGYLASIQEFYFITSGLTSALPGVPFFNSAAPSPLYFQVCPPTSPSSAVSSSPGSSSLSSSAVSSSLESSSLNSSPASSSVSSSSSLFSSSPASSSVSSFVVSSVSSSLSSSVSSSPFATSSSRYSSSVFSSVSSSSLSTSSLAPTSPPIIVLSCPTLSASPGESLSVSAGPSSTAVYSCSVGFGLLQANGSYAYSASRTCNTSSGVWSGTDADFVCMALPCNGFVATVSNLTGGCSGYGYCARPNLCTCAVGFNSSLQCAACVFNYYGYPSCQQCPSCGVGQCNATSGACICPLNFIGPTCAQCAAGLYGPSCLALPAVTGSSPTSGPDVGGTVITINGTNLPVNGSYQCQFYFSQPSQVLSQAAVLIDSRTVNCASPASVAQMTEVTALALSVNGGVSVLQYTTQLTFAFIATCPVDSTGHSCSGEGYCTRGTCVCTFPYYGLTCQNELTYITGAQPTFGPNFGGTPLTISLNLPTLLINASTHQCIFTLTTNTTSVHSLISQAIASSNTSLRCSSPSITSVLPYGNVQARVNVSLDGGLSFLPFAPSSPGTQFLYYGNCAELNLCSGQGSCQLGKCVCYSTAYTGVNCSVYSVLPTVQPQFSLNTSTFDVSAVALLFSVLGSTPFTYSFTITPAVSSGGPTLQQSVGNTSMAVFQWTTPVASLTPYAITATVSNPFGTASVPLTLLVQSSIAAFVTVSGPAYMVGGFFTQAEVVNGITLSGYVTPVLPGTSVAGRLVTLYVQGQVLRSQQARTNAGGTFSTLYFPYSTDVGQYEVLTSTNASVQASFKLAGIVLTSSQPVTSVTASPYESFTLVLTVVENPSPVTLHNLTATSAGLGLMVNQHLLLNYSLFFSTDIAGGAAPNSTTGVLPAGQSVALLVTVTFPATVLYYSDNPTIYIASLEFISASLVWTLQVQPPHPVLSLSPTYFSFVVSDQTVTGLSVQLSNGGSEVSGVVYVHCPAYFSGYPSLAFSNSNPSAVQPSPALVSTLLSLSLIPSPVSSSYVNQTLPPLLVPGVQFGTAAALSIQLVVDTTVAEGVYTVSCTVSSIDTIHMQVQSQASVTVQATVRSGLFTNLTFQVEDELTFFNSSAPYVTGALITISQLGITQSLYTEYNGTATFTNVPLGAYSVTVQAANHQGVSYTILVTATTPLQSVFLLYTPVSYVFTVVPSLIPDVITVTIDAVFDTQVPIPIVTISPNTIVWADLESGVEDSIEFMLSNLGLIDALNVSFTLAHPYLDFLFAINPLPLLPANSSVQIPVQVVNTAAGSRRRLLQTGGDCIFALKYQEPCLLTPTQSVQVSADDSDSSCGDGGGGGGDGGGGYLVIYCEGDCGGYGGDGDYGGYAVVQGGGSLIPAMGQASCSPDDCPSALAKCLAIAALGLIQAEANVEKILNLILNLELVLYNYLTQEAIDVALATVAALVALAVVVALIPGVNAAIAGALASLGAAEIALALVEASVALCGYEYNECEAKRNGGGRRLLQTTPSLTQTPFDQLDLTVNNLTSTAFSTSSIDSTNINLNSASNQFGSSLNKLFNFFFLASAVMGDPQLLVIDLYQGNFLPILINSQSPASDQGVLVSAAEYDSLFSNVSAYTAVQLPLMDRMVRRLNRSSYYNTLGINTLSEAEAFFGESAPYPTSGDLSQSLFVVAPANTQWDFIYNDQFLRLANQQLVNGNATQQAGYAGLADELTNTGSAYNAADVQAQQGICASVTVQLTKQTLTAEREDFIATLTIDNAQSTPLTSLSVALVFTLGGAANAMQLVAANFTSNDLFSIQLTSIGGLASGGIGGDGTISAGGMGTIVWTVLPYAIAAPSYSPVLYSVSGRFSYAQNGVPYIVPLLPATITVHPTPVLLLDYFLPRVVYGDDPFTALVEPSVPFAVGLLLSNVGYGSLLSLTLQSSPPVILENTKGLLVSFSLLSTSLDDAFAASTATLSAGTIEAGTVLDYRDTFSVSLMGTFVSYNLTLSESLASGNKRLALVQRLTEHLLVQAVYIPGLLSSAYLSQELPSPPQVTDPFSIPTPDTVYLPMVNSTSQNLTAIPLSVFLLNTTDTGCLFTADLVHSTLNWTLPAANQTTAGPVYYRCPTPAIFPADVTVDPLYGLPLIWSITSVITPDGRVLPAVNYNTAVGDVWLTHRFVYPLSAPTINETYIHLFDPAQAVYSSTFSRSVTYTINFGTGVSSSTSSSSTSSPSSTRSSGASSAISSSAAAASPSSALPPSTSSVSPSSSFIPSSSSTSPVSALSPLSTVSVTVAGQSSSAGNSSAFSTPQLSSGVTSGAISGGGVSSSPASSGVTGSRLSPSPSSSATASSLPFSSILSSSSASSSPLSSSVASSGVSSGVASSSAASRTAASSSAVSSSLSSTVLSSSSLSSSALSSSAPSSSLLSSSPASSSPSSSALSSSTLSSFILSSSGVSSSPVSSSDHTSSPVSSSALSSSASPSSSPASSSLSSSAASSSVTSGAAAVSSSGSGLSPSSPPGPSCASAASIYPTLFAAGLPPPLFWLSASSLPPTTSHISSWPDLTFHSLSGSSSSPPLYVPSAYAGLPAVRFGGMEDVQLASVQPVQADWTAMLVLAVSGEASSSGYVLASRASPDHSVLLGGDQLTVIWYSPSSYGVPSGGPAVAGSFPVPVGVPFVLTASYSSATQLLRLYIDGLNAAQIGYSGAVDSSLSLANGYWSGNQFAGDVMEVLLFDVQLDDTPRAYLEQTLLHLYNGTAACASTPGQGGVVSSSSSAGTGLNAGGRLSAASIYAALVASRSASPLFWLSASSIPASTTGVDTWLDLTPAAHTAISRAPPTYIPNAYAGLPAVRFNGSQDLQCMTVQPGSADWTVVLVIALTREVTGGYLLASRQTNYRSIQLAYAADGSHIFFWAPAGGGLSSIVLSLVGIPYVVTVTFDSTAQLIHMYVNGQQVGTVTNTGNSDNTLDIANGYYPNNQYAGDMMEVIFFDQLLHDAQRSSLEQQLMTLYQL